MVKKLSKKEKKRLKYLESIKKDEKKEEKPKIKTSFKIPKTLIIISSLIILIMAYSYYSNLNKPHYTPIKTDTPIVGNPNASITIKSFSEFQCSYCADFYTKTYPEIKSKYVDTGKVKFMFYEFPIEQIHPFAFKASEAARCAYDQGKYEEYALLLYSRQNQWVKAGPGRFKDYAKELGLNEDQFNKCLDSGVMKEIVRKEQEEGKSLQITGTPTFFINNRRIVGARPYEDFEKVIESLLTQNNTKN
ncbi:MAG: DsbA family protein [Candidatus Aenigmatarchaeota archaeon]